MMTFLFKVLTQVGASRLGLCGAQLFSKCRRSIPESLYRCGKSK